MNTSTPSYYGVFLIFLFSLQLQAQPYTWQDTLRGSITAERSWWDLDYYHLDIEVDPDSRSIMGSNTIQYRVLESNQVMQIDLQAPLKIDKVVQDGQELTFEQKGSAYLVNLDQTQEIGVLNRVIVFYSGKPRVAARPPWDGGVAWKKDLNGNPFVATACQGIGASIWWPCKDHMYDEPDSMLMSVTVPNPLVDVSNGQLRKVTPNDNNTTTYDWFVANPINNYGVNINIGDYVHYEEKYEGENGILDLDYFVLRDNLEKAKEQFKQVPMMLDAFEHWFGPYPFYEDGFKLVEVPYLGMEHQSSVTYGNGYQNGYRGMDLSNSGWGMKFDFIIIHESGHEWFANSITYQDRADMWIHEGFTNYSESLYLEYHYGPRAAAEYILGTRSLIMNDKPIIADYNVNQRGSGDMYYKGGNMLHTLRQIINDDQLWKEILRGLNKEFYHKTVNSADIEGYISRLAAKDLDYFFDQYLRDERIPILEYRITDDVIRYKWTNCVENFAMPVRVFINEEEMWLDPDQSWKKLKLPSDIADLKIDPNFYVATFSITAMGLD